MNSEFLGYEWLFHVVFQHTNSSLSFEPVARILVLQSSPRMIVSYPLNHYFAILESCLTSTERIMDYSSIVNYFVYNGIFGNALPLPGLTVFGLPKIHLPATFPLMILRV